SRTWIIANVPAVRFPGCGWGTSSGISLREFPGYPFRDVLVEAPPSSCCACALPSFSSKEYVAYTITQHLETKLGWRPAPICSAPHFPATQRAPAELGRTQVTPDVVRNQQSSSCSPL